MNPLDLIAPHSCRGCGRLGSPLCDCCKKNILAQNPSICPKCKNVLDRNKCPNCHTLPPAYNLGKREGLLASLIHTYKYDSVRALAPILAELINTRLQDLPQNTIIVPLPTATNHIRTRGFDHTLKIAKHLAKYKSIKLQSLLIRTKNTVQVGSDKHTRLTQAEHAFTLKPRTTLDQAATYLIFDDVWTTGASINAAIKKLQQAGAKHFIIVTLAVSAFD